MKTPFILALTILALAAPRAAAAQQDPPRAVVGAGGGATYYCIVSRCNEGGLVVAGGALPMGDLLWLDAGARWHDCFDCSTFWMSEAGLQLAAPRGRVRPFVGGGAGVASDPDFFGTRFALHAAVGAWFWPTADWALQGQVRGRRLGKGDAMGEVTLTVLRAIR